MTDTEVDLVPAAAEPSAAITFVATSVELAVNGANLVAGGAAVPYHSIVFVGAAGERLMLVFSSEIAQSGVQKQDAHFWVLEFPLAEFAATLELVRAMKGGPINVLMQENPSGTFAYGFSGNL